jgi:Ni/Co efflux regulator RcnB
MAPINSGSENSRPCLARPGAAQDRTNPSPSEPRCPKPYRGNQVVVTDWNAHKLSKPTWGAQWIQVGADYVLVEPLTHRIRAIKFYGC